MQIATWNVNSLRVRLPHLEGLARREPGRRHRAAGDEAARRGLPARRDRRRSAATSAFSGQRTYNGVAILSKQRTRADVVAGIPGFDDEQRRVLAATVGGVRVIDVYVPNGQTVGSDKFEYKLRWFEALRELRRRGARRGIRSSSCSATSTSRRRIATCTTPRPGKARCT